MDKDASTYSAVSAIIILFFIILVIVMQSIFVIFTDNAIAKEERVNQVVVFEEVPKDETLITIPEGGEILYEGLTDEEAERIINELLKHGKTNYERVEEIESNILK